MTTLNWLTTAPMGQLGRSLYDVVEWQRRRRETRLFSNPEGSRMSDAMANARSAATKLTPDEKLELISILWDDLSATPENIPFPDGLKEELDRRQAEFEKHPESAMSWDDVRQQLRKAHR
jgi:putative addiction module component (TIGR02574 family)